MRFGRAGQRPENELSSHTALEPREGFGLRVIVERFLIECNDGVHPIANDGISDGIEPVACGYEVHEATRRVGYEPRRCDLDRRKVDVAEPAQGVVKALDERGQPEHDFSAMTPQPNLSVADA